jgi:soluble lytic murein transglycosylase
LARAAYWRGRAFEAAGQFGEMKAQYEAAARYPTAYYGQLARARLGVSEIALRSPQPRGTEGARSELLQAADMLYAIGEVDLLLSFVSDLAETSSNVATLSALGELTARHNDAQAHPIGRDAQLRSTRNGKPASIRCKLGCQRRDGRA